MRKYIIFTSNSINENIESKSFSNRKRDSYYRLWNSTGFCRIIEGEIQLNISELNQILSESKIEIQTTLVHCSILYL